MTEYNGSVLQQGADSLYRQAGEVVVMTALTFAAIAAVIGAASTLVIHLEWQLVAIVFGIGGLVGGSIVGGYRSLTLKVEAQKLLWLLEVEKTLNERLGRHQAESRVNAL